MAGFIGFWNINWEMGGMNEYSMDLGWLLRGQLAKKFLVLGQVTNLPTKKAAIFITDLVRERPRGIKKDPFEFCNTVAWNFRVSS